MTSELKTAFMNMIRKHVSDPASRTSTNTVDTFAGDNAEQNFELTNNSLIYIDSIKVDGVSQRILRDYEIYFGKARGDKPQIIFYTAPVNTAVIVVDYYYGTNWIFFGYPQVKATMPRIGMLARDGQMIPAGVGDIEHYTYPKFNIIISVRSGVEYEINGLKYSGEKLLDYLTDQIRKSVRDIRSSMEIGWLITANFEGDEQIRFEEAPDLIGKSCVIGCQFQWNYPSA